MSFNKMRLIPDIMYERLHQSQKPRQVDFGDQTNGEILDMTTDISPILKDHSKPIEERIRIFYQHILRKLTTKQLQHLRHKKNDNFIEAGNEPGKTMDKIEPNEKKDEDESGDLESPLLSNASRNAAIAQRNEQILGHSTKTVRYIPEMKLD